MIVINLDVMMSKRKMSLTELADRLGMTMANVSNFKNHKAKAFRFSTLYSLCEILDYAARLNTPLIANARTPATTQTNANTKTGR